MLQMLHSTIQHLYYNGIAIACVVAHRQGCSKRSGWSVFGWTTISEGKKLHFTKSK